MEDTDTTLEEIQQVFGEHVKSIVAEVTDDKSLPKLERKRLQILHAPSCRLAISLLFNLLDCDLTLESTAYVCISGKKLSQTLPKHLKHHGICNTSDSYIGSTLSHTKQTNHCRGGVTNATTW